MNTYEKQGASITWLQGKGTQPLPLHPIPLPDRTRKCQACARSKVSGIPPAAHVWQLCCLGEFLVISMMHLHSSEVVARCGLDFLCAGYFQRGLSRHMRVRFNAVVAKANSAATFPSPRMRNRRMPRCSFKIPMTGSASAFRRRYNARPVVEANLLRMRRRGG